MKKGNKADKIKKFLSLEIGIEIKACLYFAIILFFYFAYRLTQGSLDASIIQMMEIVLTAYAMSYLQVYLLHNFDESERFDKTVAGGAFGCTLLYTAVSFFFRWYDRNLTATLCYFFYMLFCYACVFLIYKIKRDIDTAQLNQELKTFKNRKVDD
ncbi:MAG: DUF3021 family protein [Clostridium sp.]|nr:DUF3021 family protein [Clostridium sp.]